MLTNLHKTCFAALMCLMISSCGNSYQDKYKIIKKYEQEGQIEKAISELLTLSKDYPEDIYIKLDLGFNYSEIGNNNEAIKWYKNVLLIDNKNELALLNISKNLSKQDKYNESLKYINELYDLKGGGIIELSVSKKNTFAPNSDFDVPIEDVVFEKAIIEVNLEMYEKAYESINFCIDREFNLSESLMWRGVILFNANREKEACEEFQKASSLGNLDAQNLILKHCR